MMSNLRLDMNRHWTEWQFTELDPDTYVCEVVSLGVGRGDCINIISEMSQIDFLEFLGEQYQLLVLSCLM